eukprot:5989245-Pleurochrysis_carterae.AAC.1
MPAPLNATALSESASVVAVRQSRFGGEASHEATAAERRWQFAHACFVWAQWGARRQAAVARNARVVGNEGGVMADAKGGSAKTWQCELRLELALAGCDDRHGSLVGGEAVVVLTLPAVCASESRPMVAAMAHVTA